MDRMEQPFVLIDREFRGFPANFVGLDDEAAGRLATEHLIEQGCRIIAHIRGRDNSTGTRRFEGYRQSLLRHGLPYSESRVIARSSVDIDSCHHGTEAMRLLLKQRPRPDAVFCYNDPLAMGAINAILEAGLRIPHDVALIGCGNLHYDSSLRIPLSSVDQRSQLMGERAAAILLNIFDSKTKPQPVSVILDPALVIRASSMKNAPRRATVRARPAAAAVSNGRTVKKTATRRP
jgi:LacI family transcriptional regulator